MVEDDECNALRQVLEKKCPGAKFRGEDIKKLVDAGYDTKVALMAATKDSLDRVLPTRPDVVDLLVKAFVQSTDLKLGYGLEDDHPLSRFVSCLREETVKESIKNAKPDSVIKLPEGINWLGDLDNFSNELYMRPCYFDFLEAKEEYFKKQDLNTVVYTGTPGIGKSHFCTYVVAKNLVDGTVVYFERRPNSKTVAETPQFYRLDLKNGAKRLDSLLVFDLLAQGENVVYVVDGNSPTVWNPRLPAQIFASPSKELYVARKKMLALFVPPHPSF